MEPTPEQRAFADAMRAAIASAEPEVEVAGPDGTRYRMVKQPAPGVKARLETLAEGSDPQIMILWEAAAERPSDYPSELPFLPDVGAATSQVVGEAETRVQAQWFGVVDADAVAQRFADESLAAGWREDAIQPSTPEPTRMVTLERGAESRTIVAVTKPPLSMVSVVDTRPNGWS